jgi:hypothetical protein
MVVIVVVVGVGVHIISQENTHVHRSPSLDEPFGFKTCPTRIFQTVRDPVRQLDED